MPNTRDVPGQLRLGQWAEGGDELRELRAVRERYRREKQGTGGTTIRTERRVFKILPDLGVHTIADLMAEDVDRRFMEYCASKKWETSTADMLRGTLHAIIRFAHKQNGWPAPLRLPRRTKPGGRQWKNDHPPTTRHRPPRPAVYSRLVDHLEDGPDTWGERRLFVLTMLITHTKIGLAVALRLKPADVDLVFYNRLRYYPRGSGRPRYAHICPRLWRILDDWVGRCGDEWLFPANRDKLAPWSRVEALQSLKAACRAAGIEQVTFEQLRRYRPPAVEAVEVDDTGIDFDALAGQLLERGLNRPADLVRFMKGRDSASFDEVRAEVYEGRKIDDGTIPVLVTRANNYLHDLGSPLRFHRLADRVVRDDRPVPARDVP